MGERPLEQPEAFVAFYREHSTELLRFFARRALDGVRDLAFWRVLSSAPGNRAV
jgi:hypothetical protein